MKTALVLVAVGALMIVVIIAAAVLRDLQTAAFVAGALLIVTVCASGPIALGAYTRKKAIERWRREEELKSASVIRSLPLRKKQPPER